MLGPGHFLPLADLLPVLWERPSASPPAEALTQALSSYTGRLWWGGGGSHVFLGGCQDCRWASSPEEERGVSG